MTTRHQSDAMTEKALRQLDPSGRAPALTPIESRRADLAFARIVSSNTAQADRSAATTTSNNVHGDRDARRTAHPRLRWMLPLGAAAVAATSVLVPGGSDVAYASWNPKPVRLQPAQRAAAVKSCLEGHHLTATPAARALIAERRGGWAYVFIQLPDNVQTTCIMPMDAIADQTVASDRSWQGAVIEGAMPKPASRVTKQTIGGGGGTKEGALSTSEGLVGDDVVGVTVTTTGGSKVIASVDNGRYAAWWPASKDKAGTDTTGAASLDLTLRDGTTVHQAP